MTPTVSTLLDHARATEATRVGYDQSQRWSWLDVPARRVIPGRETDCSALTMGLYWLAGWGVDISGTCYTGNAAALARAAGFELVGVSGWDSARLYGALRPGDGLVGPGHMILTGDDGRWLSAEGDEEGRSAGGRAGDQTGLEVRWRAPYMRARGWTHILRQPVYGEVPAAVQLSTAPRSLLVVDGDFGRRTLTALQRWLGVTPDGKLGPVTTAALQKRLGVRVDGVLGRQTIRAMQRLAGAPADGILGPVSVRALQRYLNSSTEGTSL